MLKLKTFITIFFILLKSYSSFSQITYTKFEKTQEELISKSEPYDSIQNFNISSKKSENKKYIGQRIYLPKSEIKEKTEKDIREFTEPFLFTKHKTTFKLDSINTTNKILSLHNKSRKTKEYNYWDEHIKLIDSISTNIYKPFLYCGDCGDNKMSFKNSNQVQDRYYIITDVLYGDELKALNLSTKWYLFGDSKKDLSNVRSFSDIREVKYLYNIAFELKDEITNETFYYSQRDLNSNNAKFILVSYFVKQKQLYKDENLISDGVSETTDLIKTINIEDANGKITTKPKMVQYGNYGNNIWKCIDVTILEGNSEISYILRNKNDETIALGNETIKYWKFEKDILAEEKLRSENNLKVQQEREKESQARKLKEKLNAENRKKDCIAKFGTELGEIIASHKVKIGMTKEMCKLSWGIPIWSDKTTTSKSTTENWYYGFVHSLHFEGNLLVRIEE